MPKTVESIDEMKRNMQRKKMEEEPEMKKWEHSKKTKTIKAGLKDEASDKKQDVSEKIDETKEKLGEKKEDLTDKIEEVKEEASDKKEDIQENLEEVKGEAKEQKEKLEKESKKEGMTPAEKVLNDLVSKFREGTGQINEAISDYTQESETSSKKIKKPLVDVLETNDTIILIADISGVNKDDIDIGISKNSVELTAKFKEDPEIENAKFTQKERNYGETHRKIMLSTGIKVKDATAKFKDCTLTLTLPKLVEDITKVKIE